MKDILTVDTGKIKIGGETVLRSSGKKKRHPMMASTKKLLQELYAPYNKELVELTGHDGFLWDDQKVKQLNMAVDTIGNYSK